jgi:hypothetical protein
VDWRADPKRGWVAVYRLLLVLLLIGQGVWFASTSVTPAPARPSVSASPTTCTG